MDVVREALLVNDAPVTGEGVTIAVLDTGVDPGHPDLIHAIDKKQVGASRFELTSMTATGMALTSAAS